LGCILEPKWHDHPNKGHPIHDDGRFVVVLDNYLDLIITLKNFKKKKTLQPTTLSNISSMNNNGYKSLFVVAFNFSRNLQLTIFLENKHNEW
jgi:hypothetical protein